MTGGQRRPSGREKATPPGPEETWAPVLGPDEGPGELLGKEAHGLDGPSGQVQGQWGLQLWGRRRCQRPSPTVGLAEKQHPRLTVSHLAPALQGSSAGSQDPAGHTQGSWTHRELISCWPEGEGNL